MIPGGAAEGRWGCCSNDVAASGMAQPHSPLIAFAAQACGVPPPPHAPWPDDMEDVAALKTTRDMTGGKVWAAPHTLISAGFMGPQGVCSRQGAGGLGVQCAVREGRGQQARACAPHRGAEQGDVDEARGGAPCAAVVAEGRRRESAARVEAVCRAPDGLGRRLGGGEEDARRVLARPAAVGARHQADRRDEARLLRQRRAQHRRGVQGDTGERLAMILAAPADR